MVLNASKRGFIAKECYMDWEMIKGWIMITGKGRLCSYRAAMCKGIARSHYIGALFFDLKKKPSTKCGTVDSLQN